MSKKQSHINFFPAIGKSLAEDMNNFILNLDTLTEIEGIKDRVSLLTGYITSEDFKEKYEELKEIQILKFKLYNKFLDDLEKSYSKKDGKILMQIPSTHAKDFIPLLIERKFNKKSIFSELDLEYVIVDTYSVSQVSKNKKSIKEAYKQLFKKAEHADKFIQIVDEGGVGESFVKDEKGKKRIRNIEKKYEKKLKTFTCNKPKLRLYFPSENQAKLEGMTLKEFYHLYEKSCSLNWKKIKEANEELTLLFRKYDEVEIKGPNSNIKFDIEGMGARNSVIEANYPGSEVFSAPNKNGVNGWIKFDNEVYLKIIGETIKGLNLEFKNGRLENIDIENNFYSIKEKKRLLKKIKYKIFNNERNRYLGELAFGTNFFVPTGIKHTLIGEKAIGMHIALGNAYTYEEVNNGNHGADFHQDLIRNMQDGSIVTFRKKSGKSIEIMNNGIFNKKYLPKLSKYQKEINKNGCNLPTSKS